MSIHEPTVDVSKKILIQKKVADKCLGMLKHTDPTAIVAGGAPRDWYLNKLATDIDVFFHFRNDLNLKFIRDVLQSLGFDMKEMKDGINIPLWYKKNPKLRCVYNTTIDGFDVQLILMEEPVWNLLETFPLSISQIYYKCGEIHPSKIFLESIKNKAIIKTSSLYAREDDYLKKILDKFSDFEYYGSLSEYASRIR